MGFAFTVHRKPAIAATTDHSYDAFRHHNEGNARPESTEIRDTRQKLSAGLMNMKTTELPTLAACSTHLKLLKVFAHLREDVLRSSEPVLGSVASQVDGDTPVDASNEKWIRFTQKAAQRFEKWWRASAAPNSNGSLQQITSSICLSPGQIEALLTNTKPHTWSEDNMLPLDVLMVLHSYMLNPRCFLEDCIRFGMISLWKAGFPWELIDKSIDPAYTYETTITARKSWEKTTGCRWDIWGDTAPQSKPSDEHPRRKIESAIRNLHDHDIPLQGTVLTYNGEAITTRSRDPLNHDMFFVNNILRTELGNQLLNLETAQGSGEYTSHALYHDAVEAKIDNWVTAHRGEKVSVFLSNAGSDTPQLQVPNNLSQSATASIKRFLSAHSHASIFSLDLAAAVVRQCVFIDAMQDLAWVYSPALDITLTKLLQKYPYFIKLIALHPDHIAVPTHAVDLAWHTHQLRPSSYYNFCLKVTTEERSVEKGEFIDHDDKISENVLTGAFEWTVAAFDSLVGTNTYSECLCWHCTTALSVQQSTNSAKRGNDLKSLILERIAQKQYLKLQHDYAREVKRATKRNEAPVTKEEFLNAYVWLYPTARPILIADSTSKGDSLTILHPQTRNKLATKYTTGVRRLFSISHKTKRSSNQARLPSSGTPNTVTVAT